MGPEFLRTSPQPRLCPVGYSLKASPSLYLLEPHTDKGAEFDVHLCVCRIVGHIHRLHSLRRAQCHSVPSGRPERSQEYWQVS